MRDAFAQSVLIAMRMLFVPIAAFGLAGFCLSAAAVAGEPVELPAGNGPEFRRAMMDWAGTSAASPEVDARGPAIHSRIKPAAGGTALPFLSSRFGYRSDPLGRGRRLHAGIDIPGPLGTPIRAAAVGIVRFAGRAGGYGEMVEIDHGNGLSTRYGHLSRFLVHPGDAVGPGQTIALMGSTGRSTGSHLHFEVRDGGRPLDPIRLLTGQVHAEINPAAWPQSAETHISDFARRRQAATQPSFVAMQK